MRARLPFLIVATVCAVLVALLEQPRERERSEGGGRLTSRGFDAALDSGQNHPAAPRFAVPSSIATTGWVPPVTAPVSPRPPAPDGARLFLAGLMLVSLAAAARRG